VQGEADRIVPPEQARFLSEHLPGSRLVMLPGAGHVPFITQAARFNEIVKEIVKGGPGR
jgi:pimeloyl-ACP methyl ester carboxylesterase